MNLKTTGHKDAKISVCLAATDNGRKKETIFVFRGAKQEVKLLNEDYSVSGFKISPSL